MSVPEPYLVITSDARLHLQMTEVIGHFQAEICDLLNDCVVLKYYTINIKLNGPAKFCYVVSK